MIDFLIGAIAMASAIIGLFFLRFWRNTRDRFFLYFALSFVLEAVHRIYSSWNAALQEDTPHHYLIRLVAYGLILWAIFEKNRPRRTGKQ